MSTPIDKNAQAAMQKALQAYKDDKKTAKEFYPCTQQLSIWLETKASS